MKGINKVTVGGYLGNDPSINQQATAANFSVATTSGWKDKATGELKTQTEWHKIVVFGKLAEIAGKYLKKGSCVIVDGSLQTREYTGKDGVKKYTTEIIGREINMLDTKPKEPTQDQQSVPAVEQLDDNIPF
jgi:single-strand DNA-binding protein